MQVLSVLDEDTHNVHDINIRTHCISFFRAPLFKYQLNRPFLAQKKTCCSGYLMDSQDLINSADESDVDMNTI